MNDGVDSFRAVEPVAEICPVHVDGCWDWALGVLFLVLFRRLGEGVSPGHDSLLDGSAGAVQDTFVLVGLTSTV
jgi:hypothetical protein